jgi:hypothetical protein
MILIVLLLLSQERPFTARVTIEESVPGGDSIERRCGRVIVKPGEALIADLDDRRIVMRGGRRVEKRGGKETPLPPGFHPLEFWLWTAEELAARFDVAWKEFHAERSLPEPTDWRIVRAKRNNRSFRSAEDGTAPIMELRLIPRDQELRRMTIRAWGESLSERPAAVELSTPSRRTACALEGICELEAVDDRWFDPDAKLLKVEER